MVKTPKSMRLQIGLFGSINSGKSSLLNYISGQDVSLTSQYPGTTSDVVEKAMELLPLGPVLFLDTAGVGDSGVLGSRRIERSRGCLDRCDIACLVCESGKWGEEEERLVRDIEAKKLPVILILTKTDIQQPDRFQLTELKKRFPGTITCSSVDKEGREGFLSAFKHRLLELVPEDYISPPPLAEDLVPRGGHTVLIIPIDIQAPKGRLILPQVQTIRALLDADARVSIVKEDAYVDFIGKLREPPDLVVCDSQVVDLMVRYTPAAVPCTTFSILFARFKGDLELAAAGAGIVGRLGSGDRVLIAESCSHHPTDDDIGRKKIPAWVEAHLGCSLQWTVYSGPDYPKELSSYSLIAHCGGCMLNRRAMLSRIAKAREAGVPITNYGVLISEAFGHADRVLSPFPRALEAYRTAKKDHL